jgi:hypothetical protein
MKETKVTVLGEDFRFPDPQSISELRDLVSREEDLLELAVFGLHHRLRSAVGLWMKKGKSKREVQKLIRNYIFKRHHDRRDS